MFKIDLKSQNNDTGFPGWRVDHSDDVLPTVEELIPNPGFKVDLNQPTSIPTPDIATTTVTTV
jgi:hypothetical protein